MSLPSSAAAQFTVGPTLAYESDLDFGVGAQFGKALNEFGEGFGLLADFIIYFPEVGSFFELNGNVTYDFPLDNSSVVPFLLGGLNFARASVESSGISASANELGLNLGGGIDFDVGNFRPTAGVRAVVSGSEAVVIWITLPFQSSR